MDTERKLGHLLTDVGGGMWEDGGGEKQVLMGVLAKIRVLDCPS